MAIRIAITGGIGSGKSVVSHVFRILGIPVYDCDSRAKELMCKDVEIRTNLIHLLGNEVYLADGRLHRSFLAHYLFSSAEHVARVNAIVHPRVRMDFRRWFEERKDHKLVALESAILYEASLEKEVDQVWLVTAPLQLRLERIVARDSSTLEDIQACMAHQLSEEKLRIRANVILENGERKALLPQIITSLAHHAGWGVS